MKRMRLIKLDGATNFRDLGGYVGVDNKKVRFGKIYRADSLSALSRDDIKKLNELNIVYDCDLRSYYEQEMAPDKAWKAEFIDCHLYAEGADEQDDRASSTKLTKKIKPMDNYLGQIYQKVLLSTHGQKIFRAIFEKLLALKENQALVFHCSAGKDRTGMTAALILMGLGVSDDDIARDYLITNQLYHFSYQKNQPSDDEMANLVAKMNLTKADSAGIEGITETIRMGWGSFDNFFIQVLGFSQNDLLELRNKFLEVK
ncbi:tyrosine-protein phosphatase [Lactobacillus mulieris]|uniref:tyrosine-protein phosphatase n=1 Tax=Lactobacillus mulieris TaxID=2508708 RepID=UPI001432CFB8|nr:tyrosine-protein phosphatase [Lactobacillus mulieris]MCF1783671.1 tyrosine-protein phosphatase [Lactobacillus mulieris]MCW8104406.1 tyrosine-protein phosphatase [Lactobacillus mulieris]MDK6803495.1 tyrosine-protein phosphatase [Lactobacillus mulieris]MDK8382684.1 tyrosine-protein phosphatase [Lactobacillus mulieris]MDT9620795.1 tyrosine-protein phosphatase [Lactobacillus mulieris]